MAEPLTRRDVEHIAALARVRLSSEETTLFAQQLGDILAFADQIRAVETVQGAYQPAPATEALRADEPAPSLDREALLHASAGGDAASGLFTVPRVLGS